MPHHDWTLYHVLHLYSMNQKYWVTIGGAYERKFVVVEALACLRIRWNCESPLFNEDCAQFAPPCC